MSDPIRERLDQIRSHMRTGETIRAQDVTAVVDALREVLDECDASVWIGARMPNRGHGAIFAGRAQAVRNTIAEALGVSP